MNRFNNLFCACLLMFCAIARAGSLPPDWQHDQKFNINSTGLTKISLPVDTLNSARPQLEDLRLYDDAGNEIPYVIERPVPSPKVVKAAKSFQVSLNANNTIITIETGLSQSIDSVLLQSPAMNFIKAVRVETSNDGQTWRRLAQGRPIFRQPYGVDNLKISFSPKAASWMRLTVDDQRSGPIPFTGAVVYAATSEPAPSESTPVTISERDENTGETRLALDLGGANLDVASIQIETAEPLFMRQVLLAVPQITDDAILEQFIGQGVIYRAAVEGQAASENLSLPFEGQIRSRELILFIKNGDSPPLPVSAISIERRPVYLIFLAREAGTFHLLTGNIRCDAPRYDLAGLNMNLKSIPVSSVEIPTLTDNPDYHGSEVLPGLEITGAPLNTSDWKYRKAVKISGAGAQQVELDPDVLAHIKPDLADLRVMHGSNQVPYLVQQTSISRPIALTVTATNDTKHPTSSLWIIKLPQANLPLTQLTCISPTPLFDRSLSLYEMLADERGDTYQHIVGTTSWTQTPDKQSKEFTLVFESPPQSDTLCLETDNGDNPAIELQKFTAYYPATRLLFKAEADDELFLYYGNPGATAPRYDLSLVANQLFTADKVVASLEEEQQLKKDSWRGNEITGNGGVIFWGILGLVVVVLLVIISRLLPKSPN
jgi:hypothetical protein